MRTDYPAAWFRLYAEFATDPKVQMLSEVNQRRYIMLLCIRCSNGNVTLHETEVAFQLRISDEEWASTKAVLLAKNLIDDDNKPTAWEKRQRASDSSAERVAKHRALHKTERNGDVTLQKRQVETETETEINKEKPIAPTRQAKSKPKEEFVRFVNGSEDPTGHFEVAKEIRLQWLSAYPAVQVGTELEKAAAWVMANPAKRKKDWRRFLNNWMMRAQERAR